MPETRNKRHQIRDVAAMCVRLERVRNGLSQEALGQAIGRDQAYISQVESSARSMTLDALGRIADALKVRPAELLNEDFGRSGKHSKAGT